MTLAELLASKKQGTGRFPGLGLVDLLARRNEPLDAKFNPSGVGPGVSYGSLASILADFAPGIGDVKSAADAAHEAEQGNYGMSLLDAFGALPVVPAIAGTFIGKGAKTWDALKAAEAIKLEQAGKTPREIWSATGNWKGPDGHWRQEIPDNEADILTEKLPKADSRLAIATQYLRSQGIKPPHDIASSSEIVSPQLKQEALQFADMKVRQGAPSAPLSTILQHGKAIMSYPDAGSIKLSQDISGSNFNGFYDPKTDELKISKELANGPKDRALSTTLHELQHAIQHREGWARGGSPADFGGDETTKTLQEIVNRQTRGLDPFSSEAQAIRDSFFDRLSKDNAIGYDQKLYRRLAGEAEARATQARMSMDASQRLATFPEDSYDVSLNDLLVRHGSGPSMAIKAFHGSPHKFDAFDMSKIGTGEGAQVYGHGLYFAEHPSVAKDYQKSLSEASDTARFSVRGQPVADGTPERHAASLLAFNDTREIRAAAKRWLKDVERDPGMAETAQKAGLSPSEYWNRLNAFVQSHGKRDISVERGNLYETSLEWPDPAREAADPMGPQHFLDWDKPLSEQPESVRAAIASINGGAFVPDETQFPNGLRLYDRFKNSREATQASSLYKLLGASNGPNYATDTLQAAGIPGIRYLDQGSRGAGAGTYNYVVFDDRIPRIISRNGVTLADLLKR